MITDNAKSDELRNDRRMRTLLLGRIYYNSARPSLDCHVHDLSMVGACLKGEGVADAPDRFQLEIPSRNRLHGVRVCWRRGDRIGVDFETITGASP
jgi:hypothetical protein